MCSYGKSYIFGLLICYRRDLRQLVGVKKSDWKCFRALELTTFVKINNILQFFWISNFFVLFFGGPTFVDCHFYTKSSQFERSKTVSGIKKWKKKKIIKNFQKNFQKKKKKNFQNFKKMAKATSLGYLYVIEGTWDNLFLFKNPTGSKSKGSKWPLFKKRSFSVISGHFRWGFYTPTNCLRSCL